MATRANGRVRGVQIPKWNKTLACFVLLVASGAQAEETRSWEIAPGVTFRAATRDQAQAVLGRRDAFINQLGPFDRQVRLKTDEQVSTQQYLDFMQAQAREWTKPELARLADGIAAIRPLLTALELPWPDEVLFVLTSGKDEPGASGYCRGNAVILPKRSLQRGPRGLQDLLLHELFHVLSNQNPDWRRKMYAVVNFRPCNEIPLPDSLRPVRITNPDAPHRNYRTELISEDRRVSVVPILYSRSETYDAQRGGTLFDYLNFRLLVIEAENERWQPRLVDGKPELLDVAETPSYFDQIGRNTAYIIHPEEVLAENFVLLARQTEQVKTPRVLEGMRQITARRPDPSP